jgi:hypothetical protein
MKQLSQVEVQQVAGGDSIPLPNPLSGLGPTCPTDPIVPNHADV